MNQSRHFFTYFAQNGRKVSTVNIPSAKRAKASPPFTFLSLSTKLRGSLVSFPVVSGAMVGVGVIAVGAGDALSPVSLQWQCTYKELGLGQSGLWIIRGTTKLYSSPPQNPLTCETIAELDILYSEYNKCIKFLNPPSKQQGTGPPAHRRVGSNTERACLRNQGSTSVLWFLWVALVKGIAFLGWVK